MKRYSTEADLVATVKSRCPRRGAAAGTAVELGLSNSHVCNIISGSSGISARVAKALGFRRVVLFEPIDS